MQAQIAHRAPAVPKRVILFGFLLSLSLAILGLAGSRLATSLNSSYQEIVDRQLPTLKLIREINQGQSQNRRLIDSIPLNLAESDVESIRKSVLVMRNRNSSRLDKLEILLANDQGTRLINKLREARVAYNHDADRFMEIMESMPDKKTWEAQRAVMLESDAHYVDAQDQLAALCEQSVAERSDELASRSAGISRFFFVVAAWPLILAAGFFVYGLINTIAMFYRSRGA